MSTAVGSLALAPSAWSEMPCESSAFAVGSVIFSVSPWTWSPKSTVNDALVTVAIRASLSFTIWSADMPLAAVGAAELSAEDEPLPQPATAATSNASTSTSAGNDLGNVRCMGSPSPCPASTLRARRPRTLLVLG